MGVGNGALLATIMGALLKESNGAYGFLTFLLVELFNNSSISFISEGTVGQMTNCGTLKLFK